MIEQNELRIGNFFSLKYKDDFVRCDGIHYFGEDDYRIFGGNKFWELDYCKPIQLTYELLKRFGFTDVTPKAGMPFVTYEKEYTPVNVKHRIELQEIDNGLWMWLEGNTNVHIRYVHQLQNLYYVVSDEELVLSN